MRKVYKFSATWCGPCKMMTKILSNIESPVEIENIDIDVNSNLTQQYKIRGVPTFILIENDVEIKRKVGVMSESEYLNWVNN